VFWPGGDEKIPHATKRKLAERLMKIISHFVQQNIAETLVYKK